MALTRVEVVEAALDAAIATAPAAEALLAPGKPLHERTSLTAGEAVALFTDQVRSRALDVVARDLKARGTGYYTIGSAGHEDNAVVGALTRPSDPAFLHYRSGGFMMARLRQVPGSDPLRATALSLVASADDPISGGRHKVWGSAEAWVPPQTSTIASHLPKATGAAFALERARRLGLEPHGTGPQPPLPADAIVVCSFGDASANHATALTGINAARYSRRRGNGVPILFVCEDNGIGISVDTPRRWIAATYSALSHLTYVRAEGEVDEIWEAVARAVATCRERRTPVFCHLATERLWGHAGSDVETGYRTLDEIAQVEARDPVARTSRRLLALGAASREQLAGIVAAERAAASEAGVWAESRPRLASRAQVVAPLAPYHEDAVRAQATGAAGPPLPSREQRLAMFRDGLPEDATAPARRTLAAHINAALHDELLRRPEALLFGEDVARKGGVYYVTNGLQRAFGADRVFDTLLDETTILGVAQGAAQLGLLPLPEIQYLAYVHNAADQLRGEAASLAFFSDGRFTNPMVVRVAGLAYQKGFGGHFHNDNAIGALRDIPGLVLVTPSRGDDAARLLRGAVAMARTDGRVVVFLEPIALYHEKDLHEPGDGLWLSDYPPPGEALLPGEVGVWHEDASDLLIVTYANGVRMSLRAARRLDAEHGIRARVLDLRWLNPLPHEAVTRQAEACGRVLVVDECRATGAGIADAIIARLAEDGFAGRLASVRAADSYVPLGPGADLVLVNEGEIAAAAVALLSR